MLFQTLEFLALFAIVLPLNWILPPSARKVMLLVASYIFYGWFSIPFAGLLVLSTCVDYYVALGMSRAENEQRRRLLLCFSLAINLGVLFTFKYATFTLGSLNSLARLITGEEPFPLVNIVLPIGISFFTFQTLSYTIDVYRRQITQLPDLLTFALFVSFFPQLVAGPIVRAADFLPQLDRGPRYSEESVLRGIQLIVWGLFKKVVLADNLAQVVNPVFAAPDRYGAAEALAGIYAFAFQIYCDFSGYTDMARGMAKLLGYDFNLNFERPYFACGIRDFWRRWHISLSTWLRDYLYIPLGGNRGSDLATYRNILVTMLLGGLWHGASWTFVVWGALHGIWISFERFAGFNPPPLRTWSAFATRAVLSLITFHGVCLTWVFFRAQSFADAAKYLESFLRAGSLGGLNLTPLWCIPAAILIDAATALFERRWAFSRTPLIHWTLVWSALVLIILFGVRQSVDFVYFQF